MKKFYLIAIMIVTHVIAFGVGYMLTNKDMSRDEIVINNEVWKNNASITAFGCNGGQIFRNGKVFVDDINIGNERKLCAVNMYKAESNALRFHFCYANGNSGECDAVVMQYNFGDTPGWHHIASGVTSEAGYNPSLGQILQLSHAHQEDLEGNKENVSHEAIRQYFLKEFSVEIPAL